MKLIEEYEGLTKLNLEEVKTDFRYSDLLPDLEYIQNQLENA